MPIRDIPFTEFRSGNQRPALLIRIVNPQTGQNHLTFGLVDTGADECAIPGDFASLIGYELITGKKKIITTASGETYAYAHPVRMDIIHPGTSKVLHTTPDILIDFLPGLHMVLLGAGNFLNGFILHIDYPHKVFSIKYPNPGA